MVDQRSKIVEQDSKMVGQCSKWCNSATETSQEKTVVLLKTKHNLQGSVSKKRFSYKNILAQINRVLVEQVSIIYKYDIEN